MKLVIKSAFVLMLSIVSLTAFAQDNPTSLKIIDGDGSVSAKKTNWRIYAGPEMIFMLKGDNSVMKGGKLGAYVGLELSQTFSKKFYGLTGLNFASGGFERWINNDPTVKSKTSYDQLTSIELPLGLGLNFGKTPPKGVFAQFSLINSFTLNSTSNYTFVQYGTFETQGNVENNTFDRFNIGAKIELGIKTNFEGKNYSSFSISGKTMFLNRFSSATNQYTTGNIAAIFGYYF